MSTITQSKIDEFVNIALHNLDEEKMTKTVKIIENGLIPLKLSHIKDLRDTAQQEEIRNAAQHALTTRANLVASVIEKAVEKDMNLEEMAHWLSCEDPEDVENIMDNAVAYATMDKTMRLDPASVKISS